MQRVSLDIVAPLLLSAVIVESGHQPDAFISDMDMMTIYLEHMVSCLSCTGVRDCGFIFISHSLFNS